MLRKNYKYVFYSILVIFFMIFIIAKRSFMLSISELFNAKLSKVDDKVNKFINKGFNANITYLYYKGNQK